MTFVFYATREGRYYHRLSTCSSMMYPSEISVKEIQDRKLDACKVCNPIQIFQDDTSDAQIVKYKSLFFSFVLEGIVYMLKSILILIFQQQEQRRLDELLEMISKFRFSE